MATKRVLPRKSVMKVIAGIAMIIGTLALAELGYRSMGIFGIVPIVIGGMLTREYFRELGFNS